MNRTMIAISMLGMVCWFAAPAEGEAATGSLDTKAIEQAIGKPGEMKDDVYKVSLPRKDLSVTLDGVQLKPGFALGTWIAFKQAGHDAVLDGDLVLTEHEVGAVFNQLRKVGIQVSALHNHLIGETPKLMFLHIEGKGDAGKMATQIKEALSLTGTPMEPQLAGATPIVMSTAGEEIDFDAEAIQKELGYKGKIKDGVLHVSVPRPESIKLHGALLPPSMGMATALNFQSAGGNKWRRPETLSWRVKRWIESPRHWPNMAFWSRPCTTIWFMDGRICISCISGRTIVPKRSPKGYGPASMR